jgi:hypothetical protein
MFPDAHGTDGTGVYVLRTSFSLMALFLSCLIQKGKFDNFKPMYCRDGIFYSWVDAIKIKTSASTEQVKGRTSSEFFALALSIPAQNKYKC